LLHHLPHFGLVLLVHGHVKIALSLSVVEHFLGLTFVVSGYELERTFHEVLSEISFADFTVSLVDYALSLTFVVLEFTLVDLIPLSVVKPSLSILFAVLKRAHEEVTSLIIIYSSCFASVLVHVPTALIKTA